MKKCYFVRFLLLVMLCLSAGGGLKAQNQYINETFSLNALPSEWTEELDELSDLKWTYSDGFALFDGGNMKNSTSAFITEAIDLTNSILPYLSFNYSIQHARGVTDSLVVYARTTKKSTWTAIFAVSEVQSTAVEVTLDLSSYQSEGFQLKFVGVNNFGGDITVDDIVVMNTVACDVAPSAFTSLSLAATEATLVWTSSLYADSSYVIVATEAITDFDNIDENIIIGEYYMDNSSINMLKLEDLTPFTYYYAYVRLDCGYGDASDFASYSFQTPCEYLDVTTESYVCDFESGADCWLLYSSLADELPVITDVAANSGSNSFLFSTSEGKYAYAVIPIDGSLNEMELSFSVYTTGTNQNVYVGAVVSPADLSALTELHTLTPTKVSEWQNVSIPLSEYEEEGQYLVIYTGEAEASNYILIDDIEIGVASDCFAPQLTILNKVKAFSAVISWADGGDSESWNVLASTTELSSDDLASLSADADIRVVTTNTECTIDNLQQETEYYLYIQSACGVWCDEYITFTTFNSVSTDFYDEINYTALSTDLWYWGNLKDATQTGDWVDYPFNTAMLYPRVYTTASYKHGDVGNYIQMYAGSGSSYLNVPYLIFPELDENVNVDEVQLALWIYASGLGEPLVVSLCDGYDISTAVPVDTLYPINGGVYEKFVVAFGSYSGTNRNIAISTQFGRIAETATNYYLDDIAIEPLDPCNVVYNVQISDISLNSAMLTWDSPGATAGTEWDIELYAEKKEYAPDAAPLHTFTSQSTTYQLTGLNMATRHYVYIRPKTSGCDDIDWTDPIYLRTIEEVVLPYFNDFEDEPTSSLEDGPEGWTLYSPLCTSSSYVYVPYVNSANWVPNTGETIPEELESNYVFFRNTTTYPTNYAVMPVAASDIDMSNLTISLWGYAYFYGAGSNNLIVGIMDDPNDTDTFYPIDTLAVTDPTEIQKAIYYSVNTSNYTGTGRYIAFMGYITESDGITENYFYIDNLRVQATSDCVEAHNFSVDDMDESSLTVSWDAASSVKSYNVKLISTEVTGDEVDDLQAGIIASTTTTTGEVTFNDITLESATAYYLAVQAVSDDCSGVWVIFAFNSGCYLTIYDYPLFEDFSGWGSGVGSTPGCWNLKPCSSSYESNIMETAAWALDYEQGADGGHTLLMEGSTTGYSYAIMPAIEDITEAFLEFYMTSSLSDGYVEVGVMESVDASFEDQGLTYTDYPANDALFTSMGTFFLSGTAAYEKVELDFSNYKGEGNRIAFRIGKYTHTTATYKRVNLDNVLVTRATSCSQIRTAEVVGYATDSLIVEWGVYDETAWDIKVATSEIDPDEETADVLDTQITSSPYTITGLASNTRYCIYLRRVVADPDCELEWSEVLIANTTCPAIAINYLDDFESNEDTGSGFTPNCWQEMGTDAGMVYPEAHSSATTGQDATDTDAVCMAMKNMSSTSGSAIERKYTYAILPEVDVDDINEVELSFRAYNPSSTGGYFEIGVVTDPTTYTTFSDTYIKVYSDVVQVGCWSYFRVNFTDYIMDSFGKRGKNIVIYLLPGQDGTGITTNTLYIDDVLISSYNEECSPVSGLDTVSVEARNVEVMWDADATRSTRIVVSTVSASDVDELDAEEIVFQTEVEAGVSSVEFETLELSTYYVYASALCGSDYSSASLLTVNTPLGEKIIPYYEPIDVASLDELYVKGWEHINGSISYNKAIFTNDTVVELWGSSSYGCLQFPEFDSNYNVNDLVLEFESSAYSTSASTYLAVGVLETPGDYTSFVGIDTVVTPARTGTMEKFRVRFDTYEGESRTLAFFCPTYGDLYIDDIHLFELTPCHSPIDLAVSTIREDKAYLSFTPTPGQTAWSVIVADDILADEDLNNIENPIFTTDVTTYTDIELPGLSAITEYYVYVKGNCDGDAEWSDALAFTTLHEPLATPYFEEFTTTEVDLLPEAWLRSNSSIDVATLVYIDQETDDYADFAVAETSAISNSPALYVNMLSDGTFEETYWAISPRILVEGESNFTFDMRIEKGKNYTTADSLITENRKTEIQVLISSDNGLTWDYDNAIVISDSVGYMIDDLFETTTNLAINLDEYIGDTIRFAFYVENSDEVTLEAYFDNISVNCVDYVTIEDIAPAGFDYVANGFNIFYADIESGVSSHQRYVASTEAGVCDSMVYINLTVLEPIIVDVVGEICAEGSVYDENGFTQDYPGLYMNEGVAVSGADSVTYLILTAREANPITQITDYICLGDEYIFGDEVLTDIGVYNDTLADSFGCDSIIELTLVYIESDDVVTEEATICEGSVYDFYGTELTVSGIYTVTLQTSGGCDYTLELTLTVVELDTTYVDETVSLEDLPYEYGDLVYDENTAIGVYTDTIMVDNGADCPDMIIHTLTVVDGDVAVSNTSILDLTIYPNPLAAGATLYVDAEFTAAERDGMVVEVMNMVGQLVINESPATDVITVNGLTQSGVYIVKITTGIGTQYLGKVIVK